MIVNYDDMKKLVLFLLFITGIGYAQIVNIPDANFKAKLLSANVNNAVAYNSSYNYIYNDPIISCTAVNDVINSTSGVKIDTNNDGEIQYDEIQLIKYLNINGSQINDLTGIEAFANLQVLFCNNNVLSSLNLVQNTHLRYLNCGRNPISSFTAIQAPSVYELICYDTLLTSINIPSNSNLKTLDFGRYLTSSPFVSNLNVSSAINLRYLTVTNSQLTNINLTQNSNLKSFQIANSPITSINVSSNINLRSLNLYNVPVSGIDISQNINLQDLTVRNCSFNNLTLQANPNLLFLTLENLPITNLDVSQNLLLCSLTLRNTQVSTLDLSQNINLNSLFCTFNPILTYLNIKNGRSQFGHFGSNLSNNAMLQFVCCDPIELFRVQNSVGQNSTVVSSYCTFVPGGNYNTITGNFKFDANNNGCDASDLPQPNIRIDINDGTNQGATFTNNLGNYNFYTQAGSFVLTPNIENSTWFSFSPTTAMIPFADNNNNTTTQNFCISANGIHPDLEIVIAPTTQVRPGFDAIYKIVYKNKGNQTLSQLYGVNFFFNQNLMDFVSATTAPATIGSGSLSWSYANLLPFESRSIYVTLNINTPTDVNYPVNIGDVLNFTAIINPILGDELPLDNTFAINQTVVGSYDPNDKTCLEGTTVSPSKIGDYLHYNINFENTGTAAATFVVIKDIIDTAKFDINSLQILDSSHPMTTRVSGNNLEFIFDNINLAASQHGNVVFKIKTKSTLVTGTTVTNNANIYFDYNLPILTNTASTTFQSLNNGQFTIDNSIVVSPNPTNGFLFVVSDAIVKSIQLFDVNGRLLETKLMENTSEIIDISEESKGIYFLKITSELGSKVEKIVKK